jgi:hypothetical protein
MASMKSFGSAFVNDEGSEQVIGGWASDQSACYADFGNIHLDLLARFGLAADNL